MTTYLSICKGYSNLGPDNQRLAVYIFTAVLCWTQIYEYADCNCKDKKKGILGV